MGISPILIVEEMAKDIRDKSDVVCNFYQSAEDVPDHRELRSEKKNRMLFDDLLLEKQNICESYCQRKTQQRWFFYLAQNYFKLPRQTITEYANLICLFPKTWRTLATFSMIMWQVTWQRKNSDNCVRQLGKTARICNHWS